MELLKNQESLFADHMTLTFRIGNLHKEIPAAAGSDNKHEWTCYFKLEDESLNKNLYKMVSKVQFELHETFRNPKRVVSSKEGAKFQLSMIGWGTFSIPVTVHWNPDLKMPQQTLAVVHNLSFQRADTYKRVTVRFKTSKVKHLLYPS